MTRPIESLADVLAPVTPERFFAEFHGRKPLHVPGTPDKLASVMSWEALSRLLSQTGIWSARTLELVLDGKKVEAPDYCRPGLDRDGREMPIPDLERVGAWLRRGASLVANDVASLTPGLKAAAAALEDGVGGKAQANLYCSWKAHPGFGSHFDTHDVYALHVAGEKTWRVYQRHFEDPIAHRSFTSLGHEFHESHKGPLSMEVTLRPGDVLYLPRGWYHDALAGSEGTIHVAFGVTSVIGLDLISALFERAVQDPPFRKSMPVPERLTREALAERLAELGDRLAAFVREPEFVDAFAGFVRSYRYPRGSIDLPGDALVRRFRRKSARIRAFKAAGAWRLGDERKSVPVPPGMERPVAWVTDRQGFAEPELAAAFPDMAEPARRKLLDDLLAMQVIEHA